MKKYIQPNIKIVALRTHSIMASVSSVTGLDGVKRGSGDFSGGAADSRNDDWWDDEE